METRIKSSDMIKNLTAGDRMAKVIVTLAAYTTLSEPESYGLTWCDLVTLNVDIYLGESWLRLLAASQHLQPSWLIMDESRWLLTVGNFRGIALEITMQSVRKLHIRKYGYISKKPMILCLYQTAPWDQMTYSSNFAFFASFDNTKWLLYILIILTKYKCFT